MYHANTGNDQHQSQHRRQIKPLTKHSESNDRDEDDAKTRPQCIDHANGHHLERHGEQVKRHRIGQHDQNRRPKAGELL